MRDRLIALGMRRPTRIRIEDYDIPTLNEDDFDIFALPENITIIPIECTLARDGGSAERAGTDVHSKNQALSMHQATP